MVQLEANVEEALSTLNPEQQLVFDKVVSSVNENQSKIFCLNTSGGTGKTYVINILLDYLRSQKKIALATAMSGIAATLLNKGCTLHFKCKVSLNITAESTCSFTK